MTREEAVIILDGFKNNPLFSDTHAQALDMAISALSPDGEYIKKEDAINSTYFAPTYYDPLNVLTEARDKLKELRTYSFSDSAEIKGEWIYDKGIYNWRCSKCGQTPPPTGYVGKADFMATYFKICPNCGADMREPIGEKGTE